MTPGIPAHGAEMDRGIGVCAAHPFMAAEVSAVREEAKAGRAEILTAIHAVSQEVSVLSRQVYEHHAFHEGKERTEAQAIDWKQFSVDVLKWALISLLGTIAVIILVHSRNVISVLGGTQ